MFGGIDVEISTQPQRSSSVSQPVSRIAQMAALAAIVVLSAGIAWAVLGTTSAPDKPHTNGVLLDGLPAPALVDQRHGEQGIVTPASAVDIPRNGVLVDGRPDPALTDQRRGEHAP
jgi:hypothetical protein